MEILGCGLIHPKIIGSIPKFPTDTIGWAFGLGEMTVFMPLSKGSLSCLLKPPFADTGLERLAMVVYGITDIRVFWSRDPRFHSQFAGRPLDAQIQYAPYSKFPLTSRDISFWLPDDGSFHDNVFYEVVREVAGELVEQVVLVDSFVHPKTNKASRAFRIDYRSMERSLTNVEINVLQDRVRAIVADSLKVTIR
jgi:phenylalanyl-tRNA synthetase alpha chain